jgi:hypothetical protein
VQAKSLKEQLKIVKKFIQVAAGTASILHATAVKELTQLNVHSRMPGIEQLQFLYGDPVGTEQLFSAATQELVGGMPPLLSALHLSAHSCSSSTGRTCPPSTKRSFPSWRP